jgi:hypothetical protein
MFTATRGIAPLMEDTIICGVEAAPLTAKTPVFTWRVERNVAMTSPISKKELLKPSWSESTTSDEI